MEARIKTAFALGLVEGILLILFGVCVTFDRPVQPRHVTAAEEKSNEATFNRFYPMFEDVHVMVYVGFGYLMTFLRRFGYSAVGNTLLQSAIVLQWAVIMRGIWRVNNAKIPLDMESLLGAEFSAVTYLISLGALLGKTSLIQNAIIGIVETALGAGNEYLGVSVLQAVDPGGSIFLHTFGAYFGLALAFALHRKDHLSHRNEGSSYTSDVFAMIGTLFLWLYWPSFNAATVQGAERHRAVINTYLALTASCLTAFAASSCLDGRGRLDMVHIQNSTLSGGVAIGSIASILGEPHSAIIVGSIAGGISVLGYKFITPFLSRRWSVHDTCGVHNLHGMPGLLAGVSSIILAATTSQESHGDRLFSIYPARASVFNVTDGHGFNVTYGLGRSAGEQAAFQLWALLATLAIAISGGLATVVIGWLIQHIQLDPPKQYHAYNVYQILR
ncbi:ammonium transporter Rh type A isoform X2 [Dermacentor silvarum]|uniref:ammonium transporter Rh type A isoform X2 n=1 Tax=Dermacentor silvarum TaxID=543639 RepID=UPI002101A0C8|nr:ammonium transporter Rh type A isoform X2 [Dermacentor silvarum]